MAQGRAITGTVTDASGPVIGATVVVQGTTNAVMSGMDGSYSIRVPNNESVLVFSYYGMQSAEVPVGARTVIDVVLEAEASELDAVVAIGYGGVRRRDLTGSVSSISAKDIVAAPVSNVAQALQGKLAGVNIISQDGRPDASMSIRVRGGSSLSQSNDPLIVVDGVITSSLSDIPADQVESVDVLKDASSTAIYGSRGSNGVILVTTKGAKEGKVTVSYNGYAKFNTPTKYLDVLQPYDYLRYVWANSAANGDAYRTAFERLYGLTDNSIGIEAYRNTPLYDMQREIYNNSFSHNHDIAITGGTETTKIRFAVNWMDDEGMKVNSFSKRANVSLKVDQKIFKNLNLSLDTRYVNVKTVSNESTSSYSGSILSYAYRFRPIATADIKGDTDAFFGTMIESYSKNNQWDMFSPVARTMDYEPLRLRDNFMGTASLNWQIIEGLTYNTDLMLSKRWTNNRTWSGALYNNQIDNAGNKLFAGNADYERNQDWSMRWTNTLNYDRSFGENHHLTLLAGHEVSDEGGEGMRIRAFDFPANFTKENAFAMIAQGGRAATISGRSPRPERTLSFFGRANYSLLDRYLLTVTFRADGSSKFAKDNRWGYFPAAALAWRVSDETFMASSASWLENLKLRISYGTTGNDDIPIGQDTQMWDSETDGRNQQTINNTLQPAYDLSSAQMANPNLKWETTVSRNLGIDFSLWNGRLNGAVDAYWNTTRDLLTNTSIPGITGFTQTWANIGKISNRGVEISLSGVVYTNKDWHVTVGGNINFNRNKVDELAPGVTGLYGTAWSSSSLYPASDYVLQVGQPIGLVRGLQYDGFYTTDDFNYDSATGTYTLKDGVADLTSSVIQVLHGVGSGDRATGQTAYPGVIKFKDMDNSGSIGDEDLGVIGKMQPVHTGGFNVNARYKNFDVGMYFNWSYGNEVYNVNKLAALYGYKESGVYENKLSILNDSYKIYDVVNGQLVRLRTPEELKSANANATLPMAYHENGLTSSLGIEDGSYLRLNTLTVGYTLPARLTERIGVRSLRVYGSVYNLFTITGYSGLDPEVNANMRQNNQAYPTLGLDWGAYPRSRSFVVGLNLNF